MGADVRETRIGKNGVIIFDGACGACSAIIGEHRLFYEKHGFSVVPLQEAWIRQLSGLSQEALTQSIHLYTVEGKIFRGIDFYGYLLSKMWWGKPFALLLRAALLRPIFERIYEAVAKRRKRFSKLCGLESRALYR